MTRKIKILGIQLNSENGNLKNNLNRVKFLIEENIGFKPDIVVLPEVFNIGVDHKNFHSMAEAVPEGETSKFISKLAFQYSVNILAGSIIELCEDGKYRNTSAIFDRSGILIGKYSKIHMFSYYGSTEGQYITPGDSCCVVQTDFGKVGFSICYDLRFPELFRKLVYSGAELIVCPAAWPYPRLEHWIALNKARAIENLVYMVSVNQAGYSDDKRLNLGHSLVINPWGDLVAGCGDGEDVLRAEIDLDYVSKIREEFPVLNDRNGFLNNFSDSDRN